MAHRMGSRLGRGSMAMTMRHLRLLRAPEMSTSSECETSRSAPPVDRVERAYLDHQEWVFYMAMRYGAADRAWAEDVTQDVFICLLRQYQRGIVIDNVRAWLHRTTTNRCLTRLRRERFLDAPPIRFLLGTRAKQPATPEELGIVEEDLRAVARILAEASPKERACFYLHYIDHLSMREIGEMLGLSKGYVCKLVQAVEARIRQTQAKDGSE